MIIDKQSKQDETVTIVDNVIKNVNVHELMFKVIDGLF